MAWCLARMNRIASADRFQLNTNIWFVELEFSNWAPPRETTQQSNVLCWAIALLCCVVLFLCCLFLFWFIVVVFVVFDVFCFDLFLKLLGKLPIALLSDCFALLLCCFVELFPYWGYSTIAYKCIYIYLISLSVAILAQELAWPSLWWGETCCRETRSVHYQVEIAIHQ